MALLRCSAECMLEEGFFIYGAESELLAVRPVELYDGAVPSGNAVAALVLLQLSRECEETKWTKLA